MKCTEIVVLELSLIKIVGSLMNTYPKCVIQCWMCLIKNVKNSVIRRGRGGGWVGGWGRGGCRDEDVVVGQMVVW